MAALMGDHFPKNADHDVLSDASEAVPGLSPLISSIPEGWSGGVLNRFKITATRSEPYCYTGHMIAVPRSGRGTLHWSFEGKSGAAPFFREPSASSLPGGSCIGARCKTSSVTP